MWRVLDQLRRAGLEYSPPLQHDIRILKENCDVNQDGAATYVGEELEIFAKAQHWKAYWARSLSPYIGERVLEVGAGIGATMKVLQSSERQKRWLAIEPDAGLVRRMEEEGIPQRCEVQVGTLSSLNLSEKFDTVLYIDVLEHIEDDKAELERASERLEPGGRIIVLSPAHKFLFTPFDRAIGHFRRYNVASLSSATPSSAKLDQIFYLDSVGMLASLANRLLLQSAMPTAEQIRIWDTLMVPVSERIDGLFRHRLGKSIVGIWSKR
jgi:ubiquinone/menaquinone biosynthesis C-methylase UbiE